MSLRVCSAVGLVALFALTGTGAASTLTQAGTQGEACIFNAPDGAPPFGHVGWGFRNGTGDTWVYGATEDASGSLSIPPGPDAKAESESWDNSGSYSQMLNDFGNGAFYNDGPGYYRRYRCSLLNSSNPGAALETMSNDENSGYNFIFDNCLTKAIDILSAYGFSNLPEAVAVGPNDYFLNDLPNPTSSTPGFSGPQYFTTLTIGVKVVDPLNDQYLNLNPVDQQRPIRIVVYNATTNQPVYDSGFSAMANLTPNTDRYQATLQLPTDIPAHEPVWSNGTLAYNIEVQLEYTLLNHVSGSIFITQGNNVTVPDTLLTAGDVNGDNQVNIADYDILLRCFSDLAPPKGPCTTQQFSGSDLNDDAKVNGTDYNEMLRIFSAQGGP